MSKTKKIAIFGSSGQAGDVADVALDCGYTELAFLSHDEIDDFYGYPVLADNPENVGRFHDQGFDFAIGIGAPAIKKKIAEKYPHLSFPNLFHSSFILGHLQVVDVSETRGNVFAAGSRITNNIRLGDFIFLGVNSVVGHDSLLGDYVAIMPGAVISGNVDIGEACYIGTNASVRHGTPAQKMVIGARSVVGMGGVVLNDVAADTQVVGVPAKPRA